MAESWELYDAFETEEATEKFAKDLRTIQGRVDKDYMTEAKVIDLGTDVGRLRWGIMIRRGRHI